MNKINTPQLPFSYKPYLFIILLTLFIHSSCTEQVEEVNETQVFCLNELMKEQLTLDTVVSLPVTEAVSLTGNVEYNPDKVINFVSLVGGLITKTYFTLGDKVKKGQLLAEIKSTELSQLLSQQKSHRAQLQVAKRELESVQAMHEDNIASQRDLIEAQSDVEVLTAEYENIEAQLKMFSASSEKGVFQIKASASGIIVNKNMSAGMQILADGDPLFTIADLSEVWVLASVYTGDVAFIDKGINVSINSLAYPDEQFTGKINHVSQVFDANERVSKARIVMNNKENKLMPGMMVDVLVEKKQGTSANAIPANSLIFDNNEHFVLVYKDDCNIEIRPVNILVQNKKQVFLRNDVEVGESIISKNHLLIYSQLKK